jgi:hypothetical protein
VSDLYEYLKHPIPTLLGLFNLHRITPGPVLPVPPRGDNRLSVQVDKGKDPFKKPSQTIAESIKRRQQLNRIQKYAIYEEMDRDPLNDEILNAYGEAATALNYDRGEVFWVASAKEDIEDILTDMYATVGAQERAFAIVRTMLKHGDNMLGLEYTEGSHGIVALRPYDPWKVARITDTLGRLTGFAPADPRGDPQDIDKDAVPPFDVLHLRLLSKDQESDYGTSIFDSAWERWEDLQSMEDQLVLQRLLRRPDRLLILMDTTGMSLQEAFEQIKIWETYIYKEVHVNAGAKVYESRGIPMTENRDLILPKGPNNQTEITNLPATNANDLFRDIDIVFSRYIGTLGMPKGYFGVEGGDYKSDISLARQDPRFAKRSQRAQFSFLHGMARMGMIHLALKGLEPLRPENRFEIHGMPISNYMEIEYNELLQMRFDLVDRMVRTADTLGIDKTKWVRYVLTNVAKLPIELIDNLMVRSDTAKVDSVKDAETASMLKENEDLVNAMNEVEQSMKACRVHSGPQQGITEETIQKFKDVDSKKGVSEDVFDKSDGPGVVRTELCERAKNRLERLQAMASSVG